MFTPVTFGRYLLVDRLAVGGMGEVYLAKLKGAAGFERLLIIKQILPQHASDPDFVTMFIDEARIAVSLSHGNIAQVYELGKSEGVYFIAMEYVHGLNLSELLNRLRRRGGEIDAPAAAWIAAEVLRGLDYAHRKTLQSGEPAGVIHRDLSPDNVMVSCEGEVKIIDFGVSKAAVQLRRTSAGERKGKWGYTAPEQLEGGVVDCRADIYSIGVAISEMLDLVASGPGKDRLGGIASKASAKDPAQRPRSAEEMLKEITDFISSSPKLVGPRELSTLVTALSEGEADKEQKPAVAGEQAIQAARPAGEEPQERLSQRHLAGYFARQRRSLRPSNALMISPIFLAAAVFFVLLMVSSKMRQSIPAAKQVISQGIEDAFKPPPRPEFTVRQDFHPPGPPEEPAEKETAEGGPRGTRPAAVKAAPAALPATLVLSSDPWANVYLDGEKVEGHTPLTLKVKPGRHAVRLVNGADASLEESFEIDLRSADVVKKVVRLRKKGER